MTFSEILRMGGLLLTLLSSLGSLAGALLLPWIYFWLRREFVSRPEYNILNSSVSGIILRIDEDKSNFQEIRDNATEARNIASEVKRDLFNITTELKSIPRLDERINHMTESLERVEDMLNVIIKTHVQEGIKQTK